MYNLLSATTDLFSSAISLAAFRGYLDALTGFLNSAANLVNIFK